MRSVRRCWLLTSVGLARGQTPAAAMALSVFMMRVASLPPPWSFEDDVKDCEEQQPSQPHPARRIISRVHREMPSSCIGLCATSAGYDIVSLELKKCRRWPSTSRRLSPWSSSKDVLSTCFITSSSCFKSRVAGVRMRLLPFLEVRRWCRGRGERE